MNIIEQICWKAEVNTYRLLICGNGHALKVLDSNKRWFLTLQDMLYPCDLCGTEALMWDREKIYETP